MLCGQLQGNARQQRRLNHSQFGMHNLLPSKYITWIRWSRHRFRFGEGNPQQVSPKPGGSTLLLPYFNLISKQFNVGVAMSKTIPQSSPFVLVVRSPSKMGGLWQCYTHIILIVVSYIHYHIVTTIILHYLLLYH